MTGVLRKRLFHGFLCLHILHHALQGPVYGSWMMQELLCHGYPLSYGTLYPLLHSLEKEGLLSRRTENVKGKIRKYYIATPLGEQAFAEARAYLHELTGEIGGGLCSDSMG